MSEPPSVEQDQRKAREAAQTDRDKGGGDSTRERVKEGQKRAEDAGLPQAPPEPKTL
jgi:hypothetical protein